MSRPIPDPDAPEAPDAPGTLEPADPAESPDAAASVETPAPVEVLAAPGRASRLLSGAGGVLLLATALPTLAVFAYTEPELPVQAAVPVSAPERSTLPEPAAPREPAAETPAPPDSLVGKILAAAGGSRGSGAPGRLAGGMGRLGPISGALDTSLMSGPVRGPIWRGAPLPGVGSSSQVIGASVPDAVSQPGRPAPLTAANSSELPNARTLEFSRLADPTAPIQAVQRRPTVEAAEKALRVSLSVARPPKGYQPGETVTVRVSTNQEAHAAVIRVDGDGKASTVFRTGGATRGFSCAVRAGDDPGRELLFVVASVHPLSGAHAATALRSVGAGSGVVSLASSLGGGGGDWQRSEWAAAAASFTVQAPLQVAGTKPDPKPETKPAAKPEAPAPGPDGSAIPAPEPPAAPAEKPEGEPTPAAKPEPPKEPSATPPAEKAALPPTTRGE